MHFDLIDLQLFVNVHDATTLGGGAEASHLALASAGERLRALEARIGAPLFVRGPRGMTATPAGAALLAPARRALERLADLERELGEHRAGAVGRIRLLCNTAACREWLPDSLASFLPGHPGVDVALEESRSERTIAALASRQADLGVVSDAVDARGLACRPLRPDPLVLVVPGGHALAGRRTAGLGEALGAPFVGLPAGSALQEHVDGWAGRLGGRVDYRLRVHGLDAVCAVVARGIGLGVVPQAVAQRWAGRGDIRAVALADGWARRRLVLVARSFDDLAPAGRRLARHLCATLGLPAPVGGA